MTALAPAGGTIQYKLKVGKLENATMAHIHQVGDDGTPAAVLAWIYPTTGAPRPLRRGNSPAPWRKAS